MRRPGRSARPTGGTPRRWLAASLVLVALIVTACTGRSSRELAVDLPDTPVISAGASTGIYHAYATELGAVLEDELGVPVDVRETGGSVENLQQLTAGQSQLAFSTVDAVQACTPGVDEVDVRALARVYDDFVHLVVPADSEIEEIDDLAGQTVSLGAPGSGTELIAERLLTATGVQLDSLEGVNLGLDASVSALRSGEIDAFFWSGGLRTPGLLDLSDEVPIRLISLGAAAEEVREVHGSCYRHGVVPEGVYGLPGDVSTIAVPNVLVVRSDLPDSVAGAILRVLFDRQTILARVVPSAAQLNRTRAVFTAPVDLHPGALTYYRDTKQ